MAVFKKCLLEPSYAPRCKNEPARYSGQRLWRADVGLIFLLPKHKRNINCRQKNCSRNLGYAFGLKKKKQINRKKTKSCGTKTPNPLVNTKKKPKHKRNINWGLKNSSRNLECHFESKRRTLWSKRPKRDQTELTVACILNFSSMLSLTQSVTLTPNAEPFGQKGPNETKLSSP